MLSCQKSKVDSTAKDGSQRRTSSSSTSQPKPKANRNVIMPPSMDGQSVLRLSPNPAARIPSTTLARWAGHHVEGRSEETKNSTGIGRSYSEIGLRSSISRTFESKLVSSQKVDKQQGTAQKGSDESKELELLTGKKKAGVSSFVVKWTVSPLTKPTAAKFRIGFQAVFKKDALHDPALAEFRQSVEQKGIITSGPNKGKGSPPEPMHDDNYSRVDDEKHTKDDIYFESNDHPGPRPIHEDDVLDFSFTAEQRIIDTSLGNKMIAKRGPHTGKITGKHPRKFEGVPKTLE